LVGREKRGWVGVRGGTSAVAGGADRSGAMQPWSFVCARVRACVRVYRERGREGGEAGGRRGRQDRGRDGKREGRRDGGREMDREDT
jgi:hypothetical protein